MTNTVRDQVQATKVHLYGARRLELRQLNTAVDAVTTTLDLETEGLVRGCLLGYGTELMYVLAVDQGTHTATVVRGFQRSIPGEHAAGILGELNPRFPAPFIVSALRDEVASWGESLYSVRTATVTVDPGSTMAMLPEWAGGCYGLIDVHWSLPSPWAAEEWRRLPRATYSRLVREDLCSAPALQMGQIPGTRVQVRATVAMPFCTDEWTPDIDMVDDAGLSVSMLDIPSIGAALRLWSTQEIPRSDRLGQPEPRRAEEVPPGAVAQMLGPLNALLMRRRKEESAKLLARFPVRIQ